MADDPTPPGTNGEAEPGEDGADAPDDGDGAPGDGTDGPESADDEETEAVRETADDREPADAQETADGTEPRDGQGATLDRGAEGERPGDDEGAGGRDSSDSRETGGRAHADGDAERATVDAPQSGTEVPATEDPGTDGRGGASAADADGHGGPPDGSTGVPTDVQKYERFTKVDGAQYDRVNEFLRERTYVTAREWAMARLCADFRTETGVEMTKIGENLPELVPFMEDTYSPQAVNQARSSFEDKVHKAGATFLYGAMCDFFTAEELDELMYEVTEVAKFLLEVEGIDLTVEEELEAEDRISGIMREVREASEALRYEECPHCGEHLRE